MTCSSFAKYRVQKYGCLLFFSCNCVRPMVSWSTTLVKTKCLNNFKIYCTDTHDQKMSPNDFSHPFTFLLVPPRAWHFTLNYDHFNFYKLAWVCRFLKHAKPAKNRWLIPFPLPGDKFAFLFCFFFHLCVVCHPEDKWIVGSSRSCTPSNYIKKLFFKVSINNMQSKSHHFFSRANDGNS